MESRFLGPDPLEEQIEQTLVLLKDGQPPSRIETTQVDIKEEPGRRGPQGRINPGRSENQEAAQYLAGEMACMANTTGGGAIILGVADDGTRIGTELDPDWLRHRIFELTSRMLTVTVRESALETCRLLVVSTHEAIEPIRYDGRIRWRVNDNCVEVDPTTWHNRKLHRLGFDWSAQPSGHTLDDVSPIAAEIARQYLREQGRRDDTGLAEATDKDLIRRLNLADNKGRLSNAGALLFVATPEVGVDYIRRSVPGGDSTNRIRGTGPLLVQVADVEKASEATNRLVHIPAGFAHHQIRAIPSQTVREALVNGITHRDWHSPQPTTVEHIGDQITVTSPGGFIGGVTPGNIITHPAEPRYRSLAEALATLRLAEREGIGVDRMTRDMLAIGRPPPSFSEVDGPYVRVSLMGGEPDMRTVGFIGAVEPQASEINLDLLLLLEHLVAHSWADATSAASSLQRNQAETDAAMRGIAEATSSGQPIISRVRGIPADQPSAYRLSDYSREALNHRLEPAQTPEGRETLILNWAKSRGRVSSTEAADITGLTVPYAGKLLAKLNEYGQLRGSRPNNRGRGFHYLPIDPDTPS